MTATRDHRTTWELIPWYVNETLEPAERDRVEEHFASCARCRAEVAACRELVAAGGRPEDLAPAPHPAQLDRLVERIREGEEPAGPAGAGRRLRRSAARMGGRHRNPGALLRGRWSAAPGALRRAAAVLALIAAGVAGWLLHPAAPPATAPEGGPAAAADPAYRTLSAPEALPRGPVLRLVFAPSTPEEEIRRLLLEVSGEVVAGPSRLGVYTVRIEAAGGRGEPAVVVLDHLRRQPAVRFAELVGPEREASPDPPTSRTDGAPEPGGSGREGERP